MTVWICDIHGQTGPLSGTVSALELDRVDCDEWSKCPRSENVVWTIMASRLNSATRFRTGCAIEMNVLSNEELPRANCGYLYIGTFW